MYKAKKRRDLDAAVDDLRIKAFEFFVIVRCPFKDSHYYNYKWQIANPLLYTVNGCCCIQLMSERLLLISTSNCLCK